VRAPPVTPRQPNSRFFRSSEGGLGPIQIPNTASANSFPSKITKVDAKKGWIDIKSPAGRIKLHFPPSQLQSVRSAIVSLSR